MEDNKAILLTLIETPYKFGMNFCLNRPTHLKVIDEPLYKKPKEEEKPQNYIKNLHD